MNPIRSTLIALLSLGVGCTALTLSGCDAPTIRSYDVPGPTAWVPTGAPRVAPDLPLLASAAAFRTLHSNTFNSDEVALAYAPAFEQGWVAETHLYVPEGPTFDDQGNLYFSPILPGEPVLLVSLDKDTGARRWAISGQQPGSGGAPLILQDPDRPGHQRVYTGGYERIQAVSTDGELLWDQPTGLSAPADSGASPLYHNYGVNYLPQADALVAVMGDGHVVILDRATGAALAPPYRLPGAPAVANAGLNLPGWVQRRADTLLQPLFDPALADNGTSLFDQIGAALLGAGAQVANYFSIDPNTGTLWVASTAADAADGVADGESGYGALYALEWQPDAGGGQFAIRCSQSFPGGSASTPTLRADGQRIYLGDSGQTLLAMDTGCQTVWQLDVGGQIVGSVAVSQDNDEIYVSTGLSVIRVQDEGATAREVWRASMDMFRLRPGQRAGNLNLAGVGANGVMIQVGGGIALRGQLLPLTVGVALLDRATGAVRYAAEGAEETVSVMASNLDGALYLGHSPFRRAIAQALLGKTDPLLGGIGQYRPLAPGALVRDAACAAAARMANQLQSDFSPAQRAHNQQWSGLLLSQARAAAGASTLLVQTALEQAELAFGRDDPAAAEAALAVACQRASE